MLTKIGELVEALNKSGIRYCHWKSNLSLAKALAGQTDIDLLIDRKDANLFETILRRGCFKAAIGTHGAPFPSVVHYYALDEESGVLVHVHGYFRVITGESLTKNYHLPIEEMLLQNTRIVDSVRVPVKSAELVVFVLRMMMKHTSVMELLLLARYWKEVRQEIQWLLESDSIEETLCYVKRWLPALDPDLFAACVAALKAPAPLWRRVLLGYRLRSQLHPYGRHSFMQVWLGGIKKFTTMLLYRLAGSKLNMVPQSGGAVIAFVGPEATGKSTLLAETSRWLGEHFTVEQIHAGKPQATALSAFPNLFVPALRSLLPGARTTNVETDYSAAGQAAQARSEYPLIFAIRSVLLAYDRRSLLTQAFSRAANGTIVLCDRYPSLDSGAPDSPQLTHLPVSTKQFSLRRLLTALEQRLYRQIPPPDLVIYLSAPLELTVMRNATRGKKEPEEYVRRRHARSANLFFGETPVCRINTDQPLPQTALEVRKAIWNVL